jgi:uncharacterized protein (TIGR02001 family)
MKILSHRIAVLLASSGAVTLGGPALAENPAADAEAAQADELAGYGPVIAPVDLDRASRLASIGGISVSANASLVSQYRFRGTNVSGEGVAVQGGFDLDHGSGFYAGVWGSSLNNRFSTYGGMELDIYAGYSWPLVEGITADAGVVAYTFPDAPAGRHNFVELYSSLSASLGPATAKVGLAWDPGANGFAFVGFVRDNLYLYSDVSVGIPSTPLTIKAHLGYTDGSRRLATNSGTFDWSLGASYQLFGPISASLEYIDAAADVTAGPVNPNSANLVGRISLNF